MKLIVNQENLTVKLHRYEGSTLCEQIRLPMTPSPQACDFNTISQTNGKKSR